MGRIGDEYYYFFILRTSVALGCFCFCLYVLFLLHTNILSFYRE